MVSTDISFSLFSFHVVKSGFYIDLFMKWRGATASKRPERRLLTFWLVLALISNFWPNFPQYASIYHPNNSRRICDCEIVFRTLQFRTNCASRRAVITRFRATIRTTQLGSKKLKIMVRGRWTFASDAANK